MSKVDDAIKEPIDKGCYVTVIRLEDGKEIGKTEYNKEKFKLSDFQLQSLARYFRPRIKEFYSHEENRMAFEEYQNNQSKKPTK
jgi:hypothetical protein